VSNAQNGSGSPTDSPEEPEIQMNVKVLALVIARSGQPRIRQVLAV
jgi:hypothetical protein